MTSAEFITSGTRLFSPELQRNQQLAIDQTGDR
jgi:hypothetical protein